MKRKTGAAGLPKQGNTISRRALLANSAAGLAALGLPRVFGAATARTPDVIVIGAGLSGLNAALMLEDSGFKVTVLEGSNHIGGRVMTSKEEEVPGHPELGASGVGGHYAGVRHAAERFNVSLVRERPRTDSREGELMYHVRGEGIQIADWQGHALNPFLSMDRKKIPLHIFQFLAAGEIENPLPSGNLEAWQNGGYGSYDISIYEFLKNRGVPDAAIRLGTGVNMSYGTHPRDLSLLMALQSSNMIRSLYGGSNQFDRVPRAGKGGNQRIPEAMAAGLNSEIIQNQHVVAVRSTNEGVEVHTKDRRVYKAKYCI